MEDLKEHIAARLEKAFSQRGFAESSVAELKIAAQVSLRTLYRYYPSKESMVIGALDHRHKRYLKFSDEGAPPPGPEAVVHLFKRLADWMEEFTPGGCLASNAFSAFPDSKEIREAVSRNKTAMIEIIEERSGRSDLTKELYILFEGLATAWPLIGPESCDIAESAVLKLMSSCENK
jgi:AcrR family transcriptional regulator